MIRRGLHSRAIASASDISEATVKNHVAAILDRRGLEDRAAAVGRGFDLGILTPHDGRPVALAGVALRQPRFHVMLSACRKTGRMVDNPVAPGAKIEECVDVFPPQFGAQSTLEVEIKPGLNTLDVAIP